jgi:transposase
MRSRSQEEQKVWGSGEGAGESGEAAVSPDSLAPKAAGRLRPVPDPEVVAKPKRRQFTAAYKLQILQEVDACKEPGQIGALLRKEGLYSSHLGKWRKLREQGQLDALSQSRGRKPDPDTLLKQQVRQLEREKARLQRKLRQAEAIIEVQKKVSEILGISLATPEDDETS